MAIYNVLILLMSLLLPSATQMKGNSNKTPTLDCIFNELETIECLVCKIPQNIKDVKAVTWRHNNNMLTYGLEKVSPTDHLDVSKTKYNELKLTIKNIKRENAGLYECVIYEKPAIKYNLILYEFTDDLMIVLEIENKPTIIAHSNTTMIVLEGQKVELWCNSSSPIPMDKYNTSWFIHNTTSETSMNIGITGSKLEIVNITRHCIATYRCIVQNKKGATHMDFDISVYSKPELKLEMRMDGDDVSSEKKIVKVPQNTAIVLRCLVLSKPEVISIEWHRNKILIGMWNTTLMTKTIDSFTQKYAVMKDNMNDISILVLKFTVDEDDLSQFVCSASNSIGKASSEVDLTP